MALMVTPAAQLACKGHKIATHAPPWSTYCSTFLPCVRWPCWPLAPPTSIQHMAHAQPTGCAHIPIACPRSPQAVRTWNLRTLHHPPARAQRLATAWHHLFPCRAQALPMPPTQHTATHLGGCPQPSGPPAPPAALTCHSLQQRRSGVAASRMLTSVACTPTCVLQYTADAPGTPKESTPLSPVQADKDGRLQHVGIWDLRYTLLFPSNLCSPRGLMRTSPALLNPRTASAVKSNLTSKTNLLHLGLSRSCPL